MKLVSELVPSSAWRKNLRSELPRPVWDKIRRAAYKRAGYKCEICGGVGKKHPVECHEVWSYDDDTHIQKLEKVEAICPACHEVKHIGLAQVRGRYAHALAHMCMVNNISADKANEVISKTMAEWEMRSEEEWECDMTELDKIMEEFA